VNSLHPRSGDGCGCVEPDEGVRDEAPLLMAKEAHPDQHDHGRDHEWPRPRPQDRMQDSETNQRQSSEKEKGERPEVVMPRQGLFERQVAKNGQLSCTRPPIEPPYD
jgi:hypothetical protein